MECGVVGNIMRLHTLSPYIGTHTPGKAIPRTAWFWLNASVPESDFSAPS